MSEPEINEDLKANQQSKKKSKIVSAFIFLIREVLAILVWGYAITKLFIFDIDNFLLERFMPNYAWLLNYKFFIIIVIASIIWLITKNAQIILWSLFVVFYPAIILLWRIPALILKKKSWNLAFAFTDAVIYFFKSVRNTFITTSFFLAGTVIILQSSNRILLWCSITIVMIILLLIYIQRTVLVFRSSGVYQVYSKFFYGLGEYLREKYMFQLDADEAILPFESMKDKQIEHWVGHVQQLVLLNKLCLFVAKKLKTYQESGFNVVAYVFGILLLALFTVFSFAVINYGLFKIDPEWYAFTATPSFFTFFYYSFNLLLFNSIQEVAPVAPPSQIAFMTESFFVLFLIAIFVSLVFTFRSQKDAAELTDAINEVSKEGTRVEGYIRDRYKIDSIDIVMSILKEMNASFMGFINAIIREMM